MRSRQLSLRARLAIVLVAFTAVVLAVEDVPLATYLRGVERDRIVTGLERDAFTLAGRSETALEADAATVSPAAEKAALEASVETYSRTTGARVVVTDPAGIAVATSDEGRIGSTFANRPEVQRALSGQTASGERESVTLGASLLYVAVPVRSGNKILGAVRLTFPAAAVTTAVNKRVRALLVVGLVTLGSAAIIGLLVASAVTRRLRRFEDAAGDIAAGDLTARVGPQSSSELQSLGSSFDTMAGRVEHLVALQRGFATDASHQLRTPLTAMRLRLDRTAELIGDDPDAALANLDAVREETDRMQRLVDGLLTLARADGRGIASEPVDVAVVVRERGDSWQALAEERGVVVTVDTPESATAWAVPGGVEQIVDNYLDNAFEVAPVGTTIDLTVDVVGGAVVVEVRDRGPGLPQDDRVRAFDRFWRGGVAEGGSGLGLAIVRTLADASGATVELRDHEGGGMIATLQLRSAR